MNLEILKKLVTAGVDVVNVGSSIADAPDPKKAYRELVQVFRK